MAIQDWSPSGLQTVSRLPWGSHVVHFFEPTDELSPVLVPYFKAGLENNEQCLWVTGEGLSAEQARSALRVAVPDLDSRERDRQIEIVNAGEWYAPGEKLRPASWSAGSCNASRTPWASATGPEGRTATARGCRRLNGPTSWNTRSWFNRPFAAVA